MRRYLHFAFFNIDGESADNQSQAYINFNDLVAKRTFNGHIIRVRCLRIVVHLSVDRVKVSNKCEQP